MIGAILRNEWRRMRGGILWSAAFTAAVLAYAAIRWLPQLNCDTELAGAAATLLLIWIVVLFESFGSDKREMPFLNSVPVSPEQVFRVRLIFRLAILTVVTAAVWLVTEYPSNIKLATAVPVLSDWIFGGQILFFALLAGLLICVSFFQAGGGMLLTVLCLGMPLIALSQVPAMAVFAAFSFNHFAVWTALQAFLLLIFTGNRLWRAHCTGRLDGRALRLPLAVLLVLPWLEFAAGSAVLKNKLSSRFRAAAEAGTHVIPAEWADALNGPQNPVVYDRIIAGLRDQLGFENRGYLRNPLYKLNYYLIGKAEKQLNAGEYPEALETLRSKFFLFNWRNDIVLRCIESRGGPVFFRELLKILEDSHCCRTPPQHYAGFQYEKLQHLWRPANWLDPPDPLFPQMKLNRIFIIRPLLMQMQCEELDDLATFRKLNIDQSSREKENTAAENARLEQLEALVKIRLYQLENGEFPDQLPADIAGRLHGMTYRKTLSGFRVESTGYNYFAMEYSRNE